MAENTFSSFSDIVKVRKPVKAPAYPWQELALRVIKELAIPGFKRNSVFKLCKENPTSVIERAMNDTKELCQNGSKWQYFFKVMSLEKTRIEDLKKN
jgi:hypothetical protein